MTETSGDKPHWLGGGPKRIVSHTSQVVVAVVPAVETPLPNFGDRYRVERELGRGGMATVYLCLDTKIERKVAVKLLHPDLAAAVGGERFHREIRIATGLTHPNILPAYDSGEADGSLYYVMPYVEGESLRARLTRERQMSVQDSVRITCEIASALNYAHSQNIVHRDIKPENILLESEHAVLADFGIARAVTSVADTEQLTQTGMSLGTPAYMSPEQALGERHIDGRSDQYSLACVLYEMLAGYPPFMATTMQALVAKHLGEAVPMITTVRPAVPDELEDVIMRALEKVPADRYTTMQEFAESLTMVIGTTGTWARRTGRHTPIRTTRTSHRAMAARGASRQKQLMVAGVIVLALGGGVGTAWFVSRPKGPDIRLMGAAAKGLEANRVAVQYFRDVSATKRYGNIAGALTEGLIDQLSQIQDLDVVSRSAVSAYRDQTVSRDSIASAFKAGYLVEGSVTEDGSDIRVDVKLIDGASGSDLATESFNQPAGKAVALRDSVVARVAHRLSVRIGRDLRLSAKRRETNNDDAWLLVQQADKFRRDAEAAAAERKIPAAQTAFAVADSMLARAEALDRDWPEPTIQRSFLAYQRARAATVPRERVALYQASIAHADRIIAKDPLSAQTSPAYEYRGMALYQMYQGHLIPDQREADTAFAKAIRDLEQATKLAPRNATAWMSLSTMLANKPDFAASKLAAANAYQADPFGIIAPNILNRLYRTSYITETFNDADQYCTTGRTRFPADHRFLECWLWTYTVAEIRPTPSIDTVWMLADSIQKLAPPAQREFMRREAHIVAGIVLGRLGQADSARRVLDAVLETPKEADPDNELMSYNAYARETLGDRKKALEILKTYLTRNPEHRAGWGKDSAWWWREIKKDPEFQRLIRTGG
jgi:TolB-like protein/tRNA A-37 threonylcarbamoyl transferase component Bud32